MSCQVSINHLTIIGKAFSPNNGNQTVLIIANKLYVCLHWDLGPFSISRQTPQQTMHKAGLPGHQPRMTHFSMTNTNICQFFSENSTGKNTFSLFLFLLSILWSDVMKIELFGHREEKQSNPKKSLWGNCRTIGMWTEVFSNFVKIYSIMCKNLL